MIKNKQSASLIVKAKPIRNGHFIGEMLKKNDVQIVSFVNKVFYEEDNAHLPYGVTIANLTTYPNDNLVIEWKDGSVIISCMGTEIRMPKWYFNEAEYIGDVFEDE